jgi:hypothetical protein
MAGFISGFDDQRADTIFATADRLNAIGVDVPFLSILTHMMGTFVDLAWGTDSVQTVLKTERLRRPPGNAARYSGTKLVNFRP